MSEKQKFLTKSTIGMILIAIGFALFVYSILRGEVSLLFEQIF